MAPPSWLIVRNSDVLIDVHAQPGAKRSAIVGEHGGRLKIAIASPPVDGKANSALIAFFSKNFIRFQINHRNCQRRNFPAKTLPHQTDDGIRVPEQNLWGTIVSGA